MRKCHCGKRKENTGPTNNHPTPFCRFNVGMVLALPSALFSSGPVELILRSQSHKEDHQRDNPDHERETANRHKRD